MFAILTCSIVLSPIIGYFGRRRHLGFWGFTFGSLLFSPLMGLLVLLVTDDIKRS